MHTGGVLVGHAHQRLSEGLRQWLQASFEFAYMVGDRASLCEGAQRLQPALMVVDLALAGGDLAGLSAELHCRAPSSRLLLLSDSDDAGADAAALSVGVDGVVHKSRLPVELEAIDTVLAGHRYRFGGCTPPARAGAAAEREGRGREPMLADHPIFVVFLVAVAAPLIAQTRLGGRLPVVVFEVLPGIVIGPQVLQLVSEHGFLAFMRDVGMVAVMFMAGMEIDFARIRGRPLVLGTTGWLASLAIGAAAMVVLQPLLALSLPAMLVIALATTGLGTLLPILRDGGLLATPLCAMLLAAGTVGEVGPVVAASLVLSTRFSAWQEFALLAVFLGLVALAIAMGAVRPPKLLALLDHVHSSTQLPVRRAAVATLILLSQRLV